MKLDQIYEAKADYTSTVAQLKQTAEFKKLLETFDYKSTKTQEKNGNLYFETKPEVMKRAKEYKLAPFGEISTKNVDAGIWGKINEYKNVGISDEQHRLLMWKSRMNDIYDHFLQWAAKRMKSKSDFSNRNATSLTPLLIPEVWKAEVFNCSDNKLTDLTGGPLTGMKYYYATNNELVSPLVGAPSACNTFQLQDNNLTSFEGLPRHLSALSINRNPIAQISGISKAFDHLERLHIDFIEHVGYLDIFKVRGLFDIELFTKINPERVKNDFTELLKKYLKSTDPGRLLDAKEELMAAGLKEYAKL